MGELPPQEQGKESFDWAFDYVRNQVERGECGPHPRASLLGLWTMAGNFVNMDPSLFAIHQGQREESVDGYETGMPYEFTPTSLNVLEAYATCVLAADVSIAKKSEIVLSCQLEVGEALQPSVNAGSDLWISLRAFSGAEPCIATRRGQLDLLQSLPAAVETKEMQWGFQTREWQPGPVILTSLTSCLIRMAYPGRMLATKVPYLLRHPAKEWPRATLRFTVTSELRYKAREVVEFLLNDPPASAYVA